jgi:hypothetical protein
MRDDHYRKLCHYQPCYDKVIDLIKRENKYCNALAEELREEFASKAVNDCIRAVIFGTEGHSHVSTGGAIAVRLSNNLNIPGFKQVILAFQPF